MIRLVAFVTLITAVVVVTCCAHAKPCPPGKVRNKVHVCIPKNLQRFGPEGHGSHPPPIKQHQGYE